MKIQVTNKLNKNMNMLQIHVAILVTNAVIEKALYYIAMHMATMAACFGNIRSHITKYHLQYNMSGKTEIKDHCHFQL